MGRKVSVVIPIYNMEKYLRQCLDSIIGQTYCDLEIILVDDGSPDNCGAICEEYEAKDSRVIVIHKENGGLAAAKNDGLKRATGEWITFVDADDWIETDLFEKVMMEVGDDSPDIVIEGGYYYAFPNKNDLELNIPERFLYTDKNDIYSIMTRIRTFGLPWDKFYRIDFLRDTGLVNDVSCKAFEDYLFNFQALDKAKCVLGIPYCGYYYRQEERGNTFSRGFNPNKPKYNYDFICKLNSYIEKYGLETVMRDTASALAIQAISVALNCYYFHPENAMNRREIAGEIKEMKKQLYYHEAIWCRRNSVMTRKQKIFQFALRLPGMYFIWLLFLGNKWQRRIQLG